MKIWGLILVVVGGLMVGLEGLASAGLSNPMPMATPVIGGIVVVVGLILLATGGRRRIN